MDNSTVRVDSCEVIRREIAIIEKMLKDEAWYAGERRHSPVDVNDPAVFDRVCDILSQHGVQIYREIETSLQQRV